MIDPEVRVQIRRYFYAEHWKVGTIAQALGVHPDTVKRAIEVERFHRAERLRATMLDAYLPLVRQTLEAHPRLRATRLHQMLQDRGFRGGIWQGDDLRMRSSDCNDRRHAAYPPSGSSAPRLLIRSANNRYHIGFELEPFCWLK